MRIFLCLILLLFLNSCNNGKKPAVKTVTRPDSLISEEKMIRIMTEIHLTEAALVYLRNHGTETKLLTSEYYNVLFSRFKTSKRNFERNLEYYQQDQEEFLKMYAEVNRKLDTLSKGKEKRNKISEE
jgi:hypothetical protein